MSYSVTSLLPFFGIIRVSGEDRAAFLHNQLSNDINHLPENQACYATYNTPKGRVLANMLVLNHGNDLLMILAKDLCAAIAKRLRIYVLRSKVSLTEETELAVAAQFNPQDTVIGLPEAPALVLSATHNDDCWQIQLPHHGILSVGSIAQLPAYNEPAAQAWQCHEIQSGYPWISTATSDTCVAQMLNQHLIGGVHFKKGCYPGQEIIARAQYRGQVKRGLVLLKTSESLSVGEKLYDENNEEIGLVINQATNESGETLALAVIKFSAANEVVYTQNHGSVAIAYRFFVQDEQDA